MVLILRGRFIEIIVVVLFLLPLVAGAQGADNAKNESVASGGVGDTTEELETTSPVSDEAGTMEATDVTEDGIVAVTQEDQLTEDSHEKPTPTDRELEQDAEPQLPSPPVAQKGLSVRNKSLSASDTPTIDYQMYTRSRRVALAGLLTWSTGMAVKVTSFVLEDRLINSGGHVSANDKAIVFSTAYVAGPLLDLAGGFMGMLGERMAKRSIGYSSAWALKDSRTKLSAGQMYALSFILYPPVIVVRCPYGDGKFEKSEIGSLLVFFLGVGAIGVPQIVRGVGVTGGLIRIRRFARKHNIALRVAPIVSAQYLGWGIHGSF